MITIAVDAMGGDSAPVPEVFGAVRAARSQDVSVILVGREDARSRVLNRLLTAVFEGSTEGLVMTLLDGRKLSKAEADRIRVLIEQAEEGKP